MTTTTVLLFTAATRLTSSSCRPGKTSVLRSKPSLSVIAAEPTTTMAASAWLAACTAVSEQLVLVRGRRDAEPDRERALTVRGRPELKLDRRLAAGLER